MSNSNYPDIYTLNKAVLSPDIGALRNKVETLLLREVADEVLSDDLRGCIEAELAWIEQNGTLASWDTLARLVEAARALRMPLGAPLGAADNTVIGSALCGVPNPTVCARPFLTESDAGAPTLPPGVEVPAERRAELLGAVAEGHWEVWTPDMPPTGGRPALWLPGSPALSILDNALRLAAQHPLPDSAFADADLLAWPALGEGAVGLLKKGEVAGIPLLSAAALKGWKGDTSSGSMSAIAARSVMPHNPAKPPDGAAAWTEQTSATGGSLLYFDQFEAIVEEAAGLSSAGGAALRLAMLKSETDLDGALRVRFLAGCLNSGLDEQAALALWTALAESAPSLVSRQAAYAWARVSMWLVALKAGHSVAFLSAALGALWASGGMRAMLPLVEDARRLGVSLLRPDIAGSGAEPVIELTEKGLAIRWGLALLPAWDRQTALRFVEARAHSTAAPSLKDLTFTAVEAKLSPVQLAALVRSGACDEIGDRDTLLAVLPSAYEWAQRHSAGGPEIPPGEEVPTLPGQLVQAGPRKRQAWRAWEEQNIGVGFTDASEMSSLSRVIGENAQIRERLTSSTGIGPALVGQSVCIVGALHDIRLLDAPSSLGATEAEQGGAPRVAVAWVEDLDGATELVAFPPNYKRHQELWAENNIVIITARVCKHTDGEGVYLLCEHLAAFHADIKEDEINLTIKTNKRPPAVNAGAPNGTVPLPVPDAGGANGGSHKPAVTSQAFGDSRVRGGNAPERSDAPRPTSQGSAAPPNYELIITLPSSDDDSVVIDKMIALDKLLKAHQGSDTVTLRIPYTPGGHVTTAQLPRGVRYSSVLELEIRDLLGPDALALIKLLA